MENFSTDKPERREWSPKHTAPVELSLNNSLIEYAGREISNGLEVINGVVGEAVKVQEFSLTRFERDHRPLRKHGAGYEIKIKLGLGDVLTEEVSEEEDLPKVVVAFFESAQKLGIKISMRIEEDPDTDLGVKLDVSIPLIAPVYLFLGKKLVKDWMEENNIAGEVPGNLSELAMMGIRYWREKSLELVPGLRIKLERLEINQPTSDMKNDGLSVRIINEFEKADGWVSELGEPKVDGERTEWQVEAMGAFFVQNEATDYGVAVNPIVVRKAVAPEEPESRNKVSRRAEITIDPDVVREINDWVEREQIEEKGAWDREILLFRFLDSKGMLDEAIQKHTEYYWEKYWKDHFPGLERKKTEGQKEENEEEMKLEKLAEWLEKVLNRKDIAEELLPQLFVKTLESGLPGKRVTRLVKVGENDLIIRTRNATSS